MSTATLPQIGAERAEDAPAVVESPFFTGLFYGLLGALILWSLIADVLIMAL